MSKININNSKNSVIINGSVKNSSINLTHGDHPALFEDIKKAIQTIEDNKTQHALEHALKNMEQSVGSENFISGYKEFIALASGHMTLFTPLLSELTSLLPS